MSAGLQRIAIESAGVVTPIGQDLEAFWSALVTGVSGISHIERFPVADLRVRRGGEIKKLARSRAWRRMPDCRATRLLVSAAAELGAHGTLGPIDPARVAVVLGTALGGVEEGEKALAGNGRRRGPGSIKRGRGHHRSLWRCCRSAEAWGHAKGRSQQ